MKSKLVLLLLGIVSVLIGGAIAVIGLPLEKKLPVDQDTLQGFLIGFGLSFLLASAFVKQKPEHKA